MTIGIGRRELLAGAALAAASGCATVSARIPAALSEGPMYGLIGKMRAAPGKRDELIYHLLDGSERMAGCLSYIVSADPADPDAIWVTEAWDSKASHQASLALPQVRTAIAKARPLTAAFEESKEVVPVGGMGLSG